MAEGISKIGIYVRESRDDNGENYETIETQREMLIHYAKKNNLGEIYSIYVDDNVSGSAFERSGLLRLKEDVEAEKIDILLIKDLSRLGRNNAKTLLFLDFLEEYNVRIICSDGRYDSLTDNEMVGIETWANERYVRDISRKIRSSLKFKIQRGEYLGNAPYGYVKSETEKNRLCINEQEAEVVRTIYKLYRSGMGYTAIANQLERDGCKAPGSCWNRITVRRILCSRVYIGDTVQGVSEKVSFKSKKTRRLPQDQWVITENTHMAIISREEFEEVQKMREQKTAGRKSAAGRTSAAGTPHALSGLLWCGDCGSIMYARKRQGNITYICGNYFRNGKKNCSSHHVRESDLLDVIAEEMRRIFRNEISYCELQRILDKSSLCCGADSRSALDRVNKKLCLAKKQQERLYMDRLEERISEQLFLRMNSIIEEKIGFLDSELKRLQERPSDTELLQRLNEEITAIIEKRLITNELARILVNRITVFDHDIDVIPSKKALSENYDPTCGTVKIDFK